MGKPKVGSCVNFIDAFGKKHNALVINVWKSCLNIAYVDTSREDSFGNTIIKQTSVPFKQKGMFGYYIE